ncbi:hypothetical protein AB0J72_06760 [Dactylosporangium sp. NPDC049742]|uniref:hypothetical protein n=1 Tax=Dactylosporangium sp. NPDC049742 TaxID=3154737 RepID=UPI003441079D
MHFHDAMGDTRRTFWQRVREFAVPQSMIESATARRHAGDWAGACAAARVDVDLDLKAVARTGGAALAASIRADLRHLAPDLLRWHMPRIAPDGLLRPGLTISLARYGPLHLVVRTPPAWAGAGQRISLALWEGARGTGVPHPHPHPDPRFRLDLHRHLWDARRAGELRTRAGHGATGPPPSPPPEPAEAMTSALASADRWAASAAVSADRCAASAFAAAGGAATDRWADEAGILLRADGCAGGAVTVRLGARRRFVVTVADGAEPRVSRPRGRGGGGPVLPDAATWVLPDVELLREGLIGADALHPLVAAALMPGRPAAYTRRDDDPSTPRVVECRGERHRIGLVGGRLVALDHDPAEVRREELLAALGGTPLACLQAIDEAHRRPECLLDVRARLDHGDTEGALAVVEGLLGPDALLRHGALREALDDAALRKVAHGLFRAGLARTRPAPERRAARR